LAAALPKALLIQGCTVGGVVWRGLHAAQPGVHV